MGVEARFRMVRIGDKVSSEGIMRMQVLERTRNRKPIVGERFEAQDRCEDGNESEGVQSKKRDPIRMPAWRTPRNLRQV
jgi:hypothetical protein